MGNIFTTNFFREIRLNYLLVNLLQSEGKMYA